MVTERYGTTCLRNSQRFYSRASLSVIRRFASVVDDAEDEPVISAASAHTRRRMCRVLCKQQPALHWRSAFANFEILILPRAMRSMVPQSDISM